MDNTNITKNDLKFFSKNINFFQKVKNPEISWNNLRSDLAVKWLSLFPIKSEQLSKICSMVKRLSHPMHIGGSSPFNKKEWVIKEWPMCNRAITVSSSLFVDSGSTHICQEKSSCLDYLEVTPITSTSKKNEIGVPLTRETKGKAKREITDK